MGAVDTPINHIKSLLQFHHLNLVAPATATKNLYSDHRSKNPPSIPNHPYFPHIYLSIISSPNTTPAPTMGNYLLEKRTTTSSSSVIAVDLALNSTSSAISAILKTTYHSGQCVIFSSPDGTRHPAIITNIRPYNIIVSTIYILQGTHGQHILGMAQSHLDRTDA